MLGGMKKAMSLAIFFRCEEGTIKKRATDFERRDMGN